MRIKTLLAGAAVALTLSSGAAYAQCLPTPPAQIPQNWLWQQESTPGQPAKGRTILTYVGRTGAQLQARLLANPNRVTAGTFTTVGLAEATLRAGLVTIAVAVNGWVAGANPGDTREYIVMLPAPFGNVAYLPRGAIVQFAQANSFRAKFEARLRPNGVMGCVLLEAEPL